MKETDEEVAYVSLMEEDIAMPEEKSLEAARQEEMIEKADTILGILTSGGIEEQWRRSTPGTDEGKGGEASFNFRNESVMRKLGDVINTTTLCLIHNSLLTFRQ